MNIVKVHIQYFKVVRDVPVNANEMVSNPILQDWGQFRVLGPGALWGLGESKEAKR